MLVPHSRWKLFRTRLQQQLRCRKGTRSKDELAAVKFDTLLIALAYKIFCFRFLKTNLMIRRRKADVLKELPAKIRTVIPLEIENTAEYTAAQDDIIGWLRKQSATRAKKASKAKQLVRVGYLKRLAAQLKHKATCQWIDEFLAQQDGKLILFAVHKVIIKQLHMLFRTYQAHHLLLVPNRCRG